MNLADLKKEVDEQYRILNNSENHSDVLRESLTLLLKEVHFLHRRIDALIDEVEKI